MSEDKLLTPKEASNILGVSDSSLRYWVKQGRLTEIKTQGGHRRYKLSEICPGADNFTEREKSKICYCRVSTRSQKEDLDKQILYFRTKYPDHTIISDIGSGINFKRKGVVTVV